jgi:hypothetical protein
MRIRNVLPYLWKTPIFGFALFIGVIIGEFLASRIGLEAPASLVIFPPSTLALYLLMISPLLLAPLLFLCRLLTGTFFAHWLILSLIMSAIYSLSTSVAGATQDTFLGLSLYMVVIFFFASFIGVGAAVLMFPEHYRHQETLLLRR